MSAHVKNLETQLKAPDRVGPNGFRGDTPRPVVELTAIRLPNRNSTDHGKPAIEMSICGSPVVQNRALKSRRFLDANVAIFPPFAIMLLSVHITEFTGGFWRISVH
jgi:hypothetical protein